MFIKQLITETAIVITSFAITANCNVLPEKAKITFSVKSPFGIVNENFSGIKA